MGKGVLSNVNFIKKETLTQAFSCEFCEIFKNILFTKHLQTTAPNLFFPCDIFWVTEFYKVLVLLAAVVI